MTALRVPRPTRVEGVLAVALLCWSVAEALYSDEQPTPTFVRLLVAVVPPVAVAFSRSWPDGAAGVVAGVYVVDALSATPSGTLGAGFATLAVAFGLAAWARGPWPWLIAVVAADTMRGFRLAGFEETDVVIDLVFFGFVVGVGRLVHRHAAEAETMTRRLELSEAEREARTARAMADERAVIARELHDIVAHAVSLMVIQAGTARPLAQGVDQELAQVLWNIEDTGRQALTELRRLLHVLRSSEEGDLGPVPGLDRLGELVDSFRAAGVDVRDSITVPKDVPPGVGLCAYRAVQEGLTNAVRHAAGSCVNVEVKGSQRALRVRVQDDGADAPTAGLGAGTGLAGLHERVLLCGGHLTAGQYGSGFLLTVTLPLREGPVDHRPGPLEGASP